MIKQIIRTVLPKRLVELIDDVNGTRKARKKKAMLDEELYKDLEIYNSLNENQAFKFEEGYKFFINEKHEKAGSTNPYYWQDLWAATKIIKRRPEYHYDIGSRIDGFIAHLQSAEQRTVLLDIRPLSVKLPNVEFIRTNATNLDEIEDDSIESISALCSLEHFGLGRYGDPIDPDACFKAMKSISRVLKRGGYAYISVPIGEEHLEFNAHRVFYPHTIVNTFDQMKLLEFCVNTVGCDCSIEIVGDIHSFDKEINKGGVRFGMFEFVKL